MGTNGTAVALQCGENSKSLQQTTKNHTGGRAECTLDLAIVRLGRVRERSDEENDQNESRGEGASHRGRATHRGYCIAFEILWFDRQTGI